MKMNLFIPLVSLLLISFNSFSQDAKAKEVLSKMSNKTNNSSSIMAEFESTLSNKQENIEESRSGQIKSVGNKYRILFDDMDLLTDGKTVWTILKDAEEVQINLVPEEGDMADFSNPTEITTAWEKGFKYSYKGEEVIGGTKVDYIELYPETPDEKDYHTIKLYIDQSSSLIKKFIIKGKNGTDVIYTISSIKLNENIPAETFSFDKSKYKGFEIIDLR